VHKIISAFFFFPKRFEKTDLKRSAIKFYKRVQFSFPFLSENGRAVHLARMLIAIWKIHVASWKKKVVEKQRNLGSTDIVRGLGG